MSLGLSVNTKVFKLWLGNLVTVHFADQMLREILNQARKQLIEHDANTPRGDLWDYVTFQGQGGPLTVSLASNASSVSVKTGKGRVVWRVSKVNGQKIWTLQPSPDTTLIEGDEFERVLKELDRLLP